MLKRSLFHYVIFIFDFDIGQLSLKFYYARFSSGCCNVDIHLKIRARSSSCGKRADSKCAAESATLTITVLVIQSIFKRYQTLNMR